MGKTDPKSKIRNYEIAKLKQIRINQLLGFWPIICIFFVWSIFSHPYFLKGLVPFPSTYLADYFPPWNNFYGMPVKNGSMPDVITQIYPWKKAVIESWRNGQIPFWNPYQFAGTPLLANFQSAALSPINLLFFVLPFIDAWSVAILLQPLLAGIFTFLFVRSLRVSKSGALLSSVSFMFCGFMVTWMVYGTLAYALLYMPLLLFGIERLFTKKDSVAFIIVSLSIPLSFFSGHFQTSVYAIGMGTAFLIFKFITTKDITSLSRGLIAFLVGFIISAIQLIPSIHLYNQSVRSELYQSLGVIPWNYIVTQIAPDFFGNPVTRNTWLGHYSEWSSFIGIIPFMLAVLAFFAYKNKYVLFFSLTLLVSFVFSHSQESVEWLVGLKFPVLSTSAATRIISIYSFSAAILAGIGFDYLQILWKSKKIRPILMYVLLWLVIVSFIWFHIMTGTVFNISEMTAEKIAIAKRNFMLPTAIALIGLVVFLVGFIKYRLPRTIGVTILVCLASFDVLRFAIKWVPFDPKEYVYPEVAPLVFLQQNAKEYRVFGNIGNEALGAFNLQGIEGNDPLYINRYGELVQSLYDGHVRTLERSVVKIAKDGLYSKKALDLLGVKYILHSKQDKKNVWAFPFWNYPNSFGEPVYSDQYYEIYENKDVLPRAFIVQSYHVLKDQQILDKLYDTSTNIKEEIILEEMPQQVTITDCKPDKEEQLRFVEYGQNKVVLEVYSDCPGFLFLSDSYYPGWNVYVNNTAQKLYRANYTFRAVEVPVGKSEVIFSYENRYL